MRQNQNPILRSAVAEGKSINRTALSRVSVESGYKSVSHDCFLRHAFVPQPANSSLRPVHCEPHPGSQENGPDSAASA